MKLEKLPLQRRSETDTKAFINACFQNSYRTGVTLIQTISESRNAETVASFSYSVLMITATFSYNYHPIFM